MANESMLERVAKAILSAHDWTENPISNEDGLQVTPSVTGWDALTPEWRECFRRQASSAIWAMKLIDPQEGVPGGIAFENTLFGEADTIFHAMRNAWNATIDAALQTEIASPND